MGRSDNQVDKGWAKREFDGVALGDRRLDRRLLDVAEDLSAMPEDPINQASEDWAATKAAYRLFDNGKISAEKVITPHRERTIERMRGESVVLVVQDTTYLNYSKHEKTVGLGPIGDSRTAAQGLIMHSALALTPAGLPLGLLAQKIWARPKNKKVAPVRKKKAIEDKESYRWIETLRETVRMAPPGLQVVTVCDRESDIYEFFVEADNLSAPFVVRAAWDRGLQDDDHSNLWELVEAQRCAGRITVELPDKSVSKSKMLELEVRFAEAPIRAPQRRRRKNQPKLPSITLYVIHVKEIGCPKDRDAVEWLLLTNLPVRTIEDALEKVTWYKCRWSIEVYHKILKSGCTVEDCRLETAQRLIRYLTLMSIVAWRIFWMTHIKRTDPNAPASTVLTKTELRALGLLFKKPPKQLSGKPKVAGVVIVIARLGGFLARKNDKEPGPTAIWRGWQRLSDAAVLLGAIDG